MKRVLVQAGHQPPLQPHHETQTGAPGEAPLVASIQRALLRRLDADEHFVGIPSPGRIDDGVRCDAALFLHADGAANPQARGFSVGFPDPPVNRRLAQLIADEIERLPDHPPRRPDNNTADMHFYYGFAHVQTPGPEVLVEHGFVTNPEELRWMRGHVDALAEAEYRALCGFFGFEPATTPAHETRVTAAPVTVDTPTMAPPRARRRVLARHMLAHDHGAWSERAVRRIVDHYYATASAVGLDPVLVVAQMALETGHLSSFWSQRPRRNFAGIGVTGEQGAGLSFPNVDTAVRAHTGRLLAYALRPGTETPAQKQLIMEALAFRPLPPDRRGTARLLGGLSGRWATDPVYADKVAGVANEILSRG